MSGGRWTSCRCRMARCSSPTTSTAPSIASAGRSGVAAHEMKRSRARRLAVLILLCALDAPLALGGTDRGAHCARASRAMASKGQSSIRRYPSLGAQTVSLRPDPALPVSRKAGATSSHERGREGLFRRRPAHLCRHVAKLPPPPPAAEPDDPARLNRGQAPGSPVSLQLLPQLRTWPAATTSRGSPDSARISSSRRCASTRPTYGPATTPRWAMSCSPFPTPISSILPTSPPGSPRALAMRQAGGAGCGRCRNARPQAPWPRRPPRRW